MLKKPITIFYFILLYALAELAWWGYLLVKTEPNRLEMIVGEGSVFLVLLVIGAVYFHSLTRKEQAIQSQQRNFLLSVTHEFKSPLASIKLYLQTILMRELDKDKRDKFISSSIMDIERLDDLVENMLLATKIENRSYSFPKEEFDLSNLVNFLVERASINQQGRRNIRSEVHENIMYKGDRFSLASLVNNLIENALKYSSEPQPISVELRRQANQIVLRVCDQGVGIPVEERDKIFDKFYRCGNEMTRRTKGTGLGLFIVNEVAKNHQAEIVLSSNMPEGTCFEIYFNPEL
jgi:signal transduction histidine kinase